MENLFHSIRFLLRYIGNLGKVVSLWTFWTAFPHGMGFCGKASVSATEKSVFFLIVGTKLIVVINLKFGRHCHCWLRLETSPVFVWNRAATGPSYKWCLRPGFLLLRKYVLHINVCWKRQFSSIARSGLKSLCWISCIPSHLKRVGYGTMSNVSLFAVEHRQSSAGKKILVKCFTNARILSLSYCTHNSRCSADGNAG